MSREKNTDVLVTGAGPVGMLTALLLAERGVRVSVIDQEPRPAAHSYACGLHPRTLSLLNQVGVGPVLSKVGRRVNTVAFYERDRRHAELRLSELPVEFPFVLVLPQSTLEHVLELQLRQVAGVTVQWNHRLSDFRADGQTMLATVDKLGETAKGYIVPEWEWEVLRQTPTRASFVVGADGPRSFVRQSLGVEFECGGAAETFAVYEFESAGDPGHEMRVALDETTTNVLWPLPGLGRRWNFQVPPAERAEDFPTKERAELSVCDQVVDDATSAQMRAFAKGRAPWFLDNVEKLNWAADVRFEHRVARRFGRERCWLAGDAAHQTGPVGMQSLNAGLWEGAQLADCLRRILRENAPLDLLEDYGRQCRTQWQSLLGINGGLQPSEQASDWVKNRFSRIRECIPASGEEMAKLAAQLQLEFP